MPGETSDLLALTPFIGEWSVEADLPPPGPAGVAGRTSFAWLLGQRFVVQNAVVEHADAPDAHMIIAPDARRPGGYLQHYFDSRGVVRVYEMTFDAGSWTLVRVEPDFSPLDFAQRFVGMFSADGNAITGQWEASDDGVDWLLDFRPVYRRI